MLWNNPFLTSTFTKIWSIHFNNGKPNVHFGGIEPLGFVKRGILPIYYNCGKTHTKGVHYEIEPKKAIALGNKVLLVYDVPQYAPSNRLSDYGNLTCLRIKQYPGYFVELGTFPSFDTYMNSVFKGKTRRKFIAYKRKLEKEQTIRYQMFYGSMDKKDYQDIFDAFKKMLTKRFKEKKETNNNLDPQEWAFYEEVAYPMILEKKASLFVMFCDDRPISVFLNFMSDTHMILAITGFDIAYKRYNVGTVNIMAVLQWAFENGFKTFDFSKGHYDYKTRWGSIKYDFEYHLIYEKKSLIATFLATVFAFLFRFKQYLRDMGVNTTLNRLA